MLTGLDDSPAFKYIDAVTMHNGTQAMSNEKGNSAFITRQVLNGFVNFLFG